MFLALLIFAGVDFFLKWKGHFSFWDSAQEVSGQYNKTSIRTRFCENYFSGDMDFRKTETNLFFAFVRAEEGSGEESARTSSDFLVKGLENIHDVCVETCTL